MACAECRKSPTTRHPTDANCPNQRRPNPMNDSDDAAQLARDFDGYKTNCYIGSGIAGLGVVAGLIRGLGLSFDLVSVLLVLSLGLYIGGRHFAERSTYWHEQRWKAERQQSDDKRVRIYPSRSE